MQAAGFLEGYLTAERIFDYSYNMKAWLGGQANDSFKIGDWLFAQDRWARQQVAEARITADAAAARSTTKSAAGRGASPSRLINTTDVDERSYWSVVGLLLDQFDGLLAGYSARLAEVGPGGPMDRLTKWDFLLLNALGDMDDLLGVLFPDDTGPASWSGLSPPQVRTRIGRTGRCSVLLKVTPSLDDILMGHVTWWGYASMLRIYKHFDLRLAEPALRSGRMSFPSYPGQLSSADDWYLVGSGLVVTETSLDVYNHDLYSKVTHESLLSWQRVLASNMLAASGPAWAALAAFHNSGTYNNQYMIVDLAMFTPGEELKPGLLTIMEIIPGMYVTADATQDLEFGYWPSYNVPYFKSIYNATGYQQHAAAMAARGPNYAAAVTGLSYQLAPRAKIFRRDAGGVSSLSDLKRVLRSNGWPRDGLSSSSPWDAICARGDLDPDAPDAYGCFDGKVTSYKLAMAMTSEAINGPTTDGGLPPFAWGGQFKDIPRRGMLDVFDTEWEVQAP